MNQQIWDLYKTSERGKTYINLFSFDPEIERLEDKTESIFHHFQEYIGYEEHQDIFIDICELVILNIEYQEIFLKEKETKSEYFKRLIENLEIADFKLSPDGNSLNKDDKIFINKQDYRSLNAIVPHISLILYFYGAVPFYPILFKAQFDILIKIFDVLGIPFPELPSKVDKKERILYYNDLNEKIEKFANQYNLSPAETCACLYDFSFMLLNEVESSNELPEPMNVWLTGGSKYDYSDFLKNPTEGKSLIWAGNENTKRGDIIVVYVTSPYSAIQSIWRADTDGSITPFNFYQSRIRITKGITIPHIKNRELKEDSYFSNVSIVKRNFQGVNGVKLSTTDYQQLLRIIKSKGFDTNILPQLYSPDFEKHNNIYLEKDVEEKLLIPLLEKLGYTSADWSRQLSQKAGRNVKIIPDFVFLAKGEHLFQNAPMIIEAKLDFTSNIEKTKSYNQALSYARMMKSTVLGICDKHRLLIYKEKNGYFDRFNPSFENYWQNLNDAEVFSELKQLIGKDFINKNN
ncbi:hypothetical protein NLM59_01900 [Weeksellaceae bacterium KMM 9724]|uniref:hypothetical protein n=1 Tax=Profundicola chukchiensis TaxID=2961959 RepID=UPI0024392BC9|nr:hypothetical protein [Profundicola chukchiensis]MDG4949665.1 hypothetical protein [Profundicola chukchiensis]